MIGGRRLRKFGRSTKRQTILPLQVSHISYTISCWYCDLKSRFFNDPLFRFGRKHSRWLRGWFSMGIGFSLSSLVGVTVILLFELGFALHFYVGSAWFSSLLNDSLFGFFSPISRLSISLSDVGYMCSSTVISVFFHELGHALAAASEGIQMEYVAVFLAVIFPGALVAFNYEHLLSLPYIATLRIYCAGIWHNAVFSAACVVLLVLLPLILYPFYIHGESPMVLDVSSASPLFKKLSPGDLLVSIDGVHVHDVQEWGRIIALLNERAFQNSNNLTDFVNSSKLDDRKGYCIPLSLVKGGTPIELEGNQNCPDELSAFTISPCGSTRTLDDTILEHKYQKKGSSAHCFNANDIVKLKKCRDGRAKAQRDTNNCQCSEGEFCMAPIEIPGSTWVEITYISSSSPRCRSLAANPFSDYYKEDVSLESNCLNTFVFVGDVISMEESLYLTSYRPRWALELSMYIPNMVEKLLTCCFQVSTALALLNSLPVYFLDGESILGVCLQYFHLLDSRKREIIHRWCLRGGTIICILLFLLLFINIW